MPNLNPRQTPAACRVAMAHDREHAAACLVKGKWLQKAKAGGPPLDLGQSPPARMPSVGFVPSRVTPHPGPWLLPPALRPLWRAPWLFGKQKNTMKTML
ncbi:hypothetical protein Mmc1_2870 [Magnetococcus marinus MC-1]|uniref:Uncharacterized protein n=1 Tax=Magnetococcus marinus (strain ATCC BAA-1437 / JCM 17883 / MC-1) TaxID=156889 RepID=A0LBL9_MAGMM|nr:hypothetical protein Mmc1_2870 [Magnetococcus marinus MC-1]